MKDYNRYTIDTEAPFYSRLQSLLTSSVLNITKEEIDSLYSSWNSNFESLNIVNKYYSDSLISREQNIPSDAILKGIDFPIWFGDLSKKKIVILGIDPLRNIKNFEETNASDYKKDVIIGTPYSFHDKTSREGACKGYWTFIKGLADSNNFIYVTDIFKTYYFDPLNKKRSYNDDSFIGTFSQSVHSDILMKELSFIQPDLIIVFGKVAHSFLMKRKAPKVSQNLTNTKTNLLIDSGSVEVYTVLHLSKTTRGKNFIDFFKHNNVEISDFDPENRIQCANLYLSMLRNAKVIY
jgi:hypothetical protein